MIIKSIRAFAIDPSLAKKKQAPGYKQAGRQPAGPMERYPAYKGRRGNAGPAWKQVGCLVEAEDGTWGFGVSAFAPPVVSIVNDHFSEHLVGQPVMATEKHFDMMTRLAMPYGAEGPAAYAVSAVDLALWDLKGKMLERPVYELLGGPQKEKITCYATGFDLEWYLDLGFRAVKLPMIYGPEDGLEGINKAEAMIAEARAQIGDDVELMLDCWMALDVEYTVRLGEVLKPYRLKWIEDYLLPNNMRGFAEVRQRLPRQGLATGEHWYLSPTFSQAAEQRLVDFFQPDLLWAGGISACVRICHIAEGAGIAVVPHGGMNWPFGQHLAFAMPSVSLGERSGGVSQPGVALEDMVDIPGTAVIRDGHLIPSDAPGFGMEIDENWLEKVTV